MAAVLRHHAAGASIPQPQRTVEAAGGHHRRRVLPLQVDDAGLREHGGRGILTQSATVLLIMSPPCGEDSDDINAAGTVKPALMIRLTEGQRFISSVSNAGTLPVSAPPHLVSEAVSQHLRRQVVHGQGALQVRHGDERQPGNGRNRGQA